MTTTPPAQVDGAVLAKSLRATFDSGRTRPLAWRKEQLAGLRRMMDEAEAELLEALRLDLGRPKVEAFAADIGHTKQELRHMAKHVERWMKPAKVHMPLLVAPAKGWIVPEPLGVALVIAPWNYPIQLLIEPMGAALAAGNCVLAKPSELAPACSAAMARLLPRYVDPEAVVVVEGGVDETTALLAERWDHIFFTGSTAVGHVVAEAAAKHLTPDGARARRQVAYVCTRERRPRRGRSSHRVGQVPERRSDVHRARLRPRRRTDQGRAGRQAGEADRRVLRI